MCGDCCKTWLSQLMAVPGLPRMKPRYAGPPPDSIAGMPLHDCKHCRCPRLQFCMTVTHLKSKKNWHFSWPLPRDMTKLLIAVHVAHTVTIVSASISYSASVIMVYLHHYSPILW